jgi:hypothetical protein
MINVHRWTTGVGFAFLCAACAAPAGTPGAPRNDAAVRAAPAAPIGPPPPAAMDELLAADRAFSAASAKTDLVSGLSAMFAPDVAMPIPGSKFSANAAEALAALRANPDNAKSRTDWTPAGGGISADGQQGYTWGYMVVRKPDGSASGLKYLSYWVKRVEGWRVAAFKRRGRPDGPASLEPLALSLPPRSVAPVIDVALMASYRASLDRTERKFSDDSKVVGLGVAFARYGTPDSINLGGADNAGFVVGAEAIGMFVSEGKPAEPSTLVWAPDRTIVASSGDLGVTLGIIRETAPEAGSTAPTLFPFFTVWQRRGPQDPWRYIAE